MDEAEQTNQATGTAGETAPTTVVATEEKRFSQAEMDAVVGKRLAEDRAKRNAQSASKPATGTDGEDRVTIKQLQARLDEQDLRARFDKRAARAGFSDEDADELFEVVRAKPPEDLGAWLERKAKVYGLGTKPTTAQPTQPAAPAAAATTAPRSVDPVNSGGIVDLWAMSPEALSKLKPHEVRTHFERIKSEHASAIGAPPKPKGMPLRKA